MTALVARRLAQALVLLISLSIVGCEHHAEDPGTLLDRAWQALRVGDARTADRLFEAAAIHSNAADVKAEAAYGRAMLLLTSVDPAERRQMLAYLEESLRIDPNGSKAPWARLAKARWVDTESPPQGSEPVPEKVRQAYQSVIDAHPGHPAAVEATVSRIARLAASTVEQDLNDAIMLADEALASNPDPQWVPTLHSFRANVFRVLRNHEARLDALIKSLQAAKSVAIELKPDFSGAYWSIATTAEFDVGDLALARTYYQRFLDEYPQDQRGLTAEQAVKRIDRILQRLKAGEEARLVLREEAP